MKNLQCLALMLAIAPAAHGATYYIPLSKSGDTATNIVLTNRPCTMPASEGRWMATP